jgi:3-oxoacyl-[acyl-carrier-protein] synthase II
MVRLDPACPAGREHHVSGTRRGRNPVLGFVSPTMVATRLDPSAPPRRTVVTGMGVIAPNGQNLDTFWNSVRKGINAARVISQFDASDFPRDQLVAAEVRDFEPMRYMDAKSARRYDKTIKYAVAAARTAVQDARLSPASVDPDRTGVVEGTTISGLERVFRSHRAFLKVGPSGVNPIDVINGYCGEGSSVLALELGLRAHSVTICSGCASSNDAIGYSLKMIRDDEADVMVTGGTDANLTRELWASWCSLNVMTSRKDDPASSMRPFDRTRDGFVLGEGAAFMVLEELSHALSRGATIYAEVLAQCRSCESHHLIEPHPGGMGLRRAMEKALRVARVAPAEVDYINAHGSATKVHDPIETAVIKSVFAKHARRVAISSTKPVTGHLMGAAGAAEAMVAVLSIFHQEIPPTINLREPDPECDLDYVPLKSRPYPVRVALNLNSGFGGKNSCLVLARYAGDAS